METRTLGSLWPVSALTIGGGGLGGVWGSRTRDEAIATLRAAVDGGITLVDVAPSYGDGEAELVVGAAFEGRLPPGVRVVTKHHVGPGGTGEPSPDDVLPAMTAALEESLERMRLDHVDLFILHSQILPVADPEKETWTTTIDYFEQAARPALQSLVDQGRVGAWGITAAQFPSVLERAFGGEPAPQAAQMVANVLDAPGDMSWSDEPTDYRCLVQAARDRGVGVMGIRAVQAGAFTDSIDRELEPDHPASVDFERAAPLRGLAAEMGEPTAVLAHRYALSMEGVDTVVLGVKNRDELNECLRAAEQGPLPEDVWARIEELAAPIRASGSAD